MAHKKAAGSAKNLRDSNPNYHWLKINWGQFARAWNIIIRQQGQKYRCGVGTYLAKDFTIHATYDGIVSFRQKSFMRFDWRKYKRTVVDILPEGTASEAKPEKALKAKKTAAPKAEKKAAPAKKDAPAKEAKSAAPKAEKAAAPAKEAKASGWADDLTKIEGIWPKIAEVMAANWVKTFEDLSASKVGDLRTILADNKLSQHDPKTWKKQATLAKNGKWDELKVLQDELDWGK